MHSYTGPTKLVASYLYYVGPVFSKCRVWGRVRLLCILWTWKAVRKKLKTDFVFTYRESQDGPIISLIWCILCLLLQGHGNVSQCLALCLIAFSWVNHFLESVNSFEYPVRDNISCYRLASLNHDHKISRIVVILSCLLLQLAFELPICRY